MADTNDDEWLYGSGGDDQAPEQQEEPGNEDDELEISSKNANIEKAFETFDEHNFEEAGDHEQLTAEDSKDGNEESQEGEDDDSDDDDDDINVVIGDIKSGGPSNYVKGAPDQKQKQSSKFNIEEFESVGTINGQPAFEFAIESIEDKPWRKPGADITDYFNYGFNEETWRAYCERQKRMRIHESGIGLASLTAAQNPNQAMNSSNDMSMKPNMGFKRLGPRPPKPHVGTIDVIGAPSQNPVRPPAPRENVIQVMTADRREYSRVVNQPQMNPMQFNVPPEDFYHEEQEPFYGGYEPTQDSQGWDNQGWAPSEIKELTPMNQPPPMNPMQRDNMRVNMNIPPPMMGNMPQHRMPMMHHPNPQNMIPPHLGQIPPIQIKQEMDEKRDSRNNRMSNRDFRDDSHRSRDDRKRMRERSTSRDREARKPERVRDDRGRSDRDSRYSRETSSRRRSKSRERSRRSKSRDKMRSRSKDRKADDKDRGSRSDKSKRSKKEDS